MPKSLAEISFEHAFRSLVELTTHRYDYDASGWIFFQKPGEEEYYTEYKTECAEEAFSKLVNDCTQNLKAPTLMYLIKAMTEVSSFQKSKQDTIELEASSKQAIASSKIEELQTKLRQYLDGEEE